MRHLLPDVELGADQYLKYADATQNPELQRVFQRIQADCSNDAEAIRTRVRELGGKPKSGPSALRALAKFSDAVSALGGRDEKSLLESAVSNEYIRAMCFETALGRGLEYRCREIAENGLERAKQNADQLSELLCRYEDPEEVRRYREELERINHQPQNRNATEILPFP
nr:DUF2383 domain-containing protein [Feifania hominis]